MNIDELKVKIFADGADIEQIRKLAANSLIAGFTTNPTLCRKAGVTDYAAFCKEAAQLVAPRPISFEVFADDETEMLAQANAISKWGENVYVKIPITNTKGESMRRVVRWLLADGIKVNVTAVTTVEQVTEIWPSMYGQTPSYLSIFAGRVADTGVDPLKVMRQATSIIRKPIELIWASPREVLNVYQANDIGCDIITATPDILAKLSLCGKDLTEYSLDTVKMFHSDAVSAAYAI